MRRADKSPAMRFIIRVRDYGNTYVATGGGKRASCTESPYSAAFALAGKLNLGPGFTVTEHGHGDARFYRAEEAR